MEAFLVVYARKFSRLFAFDKNRNLVEEETSTIAKQLTGEVDKIRRKPTIPLILIIVDTTGTETSSPATGRSLHRILAVS